MPPTVGERSNKVEFGLLLCVIALNALRFKNNNVKFVKGRDYLRRKCIKCLVFGSMIYRNSRRDY